MNIIRNNNVITLTPEEMREAFREMDYQYMKEDAKSAFERIFKILKDPDRFEETFGFPAKLAINENSPYYILHKAIATFAEQQDSCVADMNTWNKVLNDIMLDLRNRWETGKVPFFGTSITLSDTSMLENISIVKNDDFQIEYEDGYINFEMDTTFFDVDEAFGLFCNTEKNDDYVNVYVNWYPNQLPSMAVIYMADAEMQELPVFLTDEQKEKLSSLLPGMCENALGYRPEDIWTEVQYEAENALQKCKRKDRAVKLHRNTLSDCGTEVQETVVLDGHWLETYLTVNDISLEEFQKEYTSEDVDALLGDAILQNGYLFSYHSDSDNLFECMEDEKWKFRAFADFIAQTLQDEGFEDASKAIDAMLGL